MSYYRRRLPHWHPESAPLFITWRLFGTLPAHVAGKVVGTHRGSAGQAFALADRQLDRAIHGPRWLADTRVAAIVVDTLKRGETPLGQYALHSFVVMPNHVHILLTPRIVVRRIMTGIKGVTARKANQILGRAGKHFWQDESFDHWVRTDAEFEKIRTYIENNPVAARLVRRAEEWPWSSAWKPR
jgi:putative transposase